MAHPIAENSVDDLALLPAAPPLSRMYAYTIDWVLGGIVTGLPAVLLYAGVTRRTDMLANLYVFEALGYPWALGVGAGALCLVAGMAYFVLIPTALWRGQTPGKRIAKIRVISLRGTDCSFAQLMLRQVVIGFLVEGSGFAAARYLREVAVLVTRVDVNYYWELAGMVLTTISVLLALAHPARRALHDLASKTRVVPAEGHPMYGAKARRRLKGSIK